MAKRFIDTGLFDDEWFCNLSTDGKIFWLYYLTKCDHAGILKVNKRLIEFHTGIKSLVTVIEELGNRLVRVSEEYYFCPKFIKFQYPDFPKSKVKQQEGAVKILESFGINPVTFEFTTKINSSETVNQELTNSYGNVNGNVNGNGNGNVKEPRAKKKEPEIPTLSEFVTYGLSLVQNNQGYKQPLEAKYNAWHEAGWKDGHGVSILNWKTKLQNTIQYLRPMPTANTGKTPLTEDIGKMDYSKTTF